MSPSNFNRFSSAFILTTLVFIFASKPTFSIDSKALQGTEDIDWRKSSQPFLSQGELTDEEHLTKMRQERESDRMRRLKERLGKDYSSGEPLESSRMGSSSPDSIRGSNNERPRFEDQRAPFRLDEKTLEKARRSKLERIGRDLNPLRFDPERAGTSRSLKLPSELDDEASEDLVPEATGLRVEHEELTTLETPKSKIESVFIGHFPDEVSRKVEQFGYNLFTRGARDFSQLEDVPINPDYVVGPGDTFTINVWGSANFTHLVTIRRDGSIFIPKIGTIKVWGDTFQQLTKKIEKKLSSFFSGIKVNIAFEEIRQIDVFVVGEVAKPGSYTVPSTSAPINVLFHAGGPTKNGSLRKIQIVRGGQKIADVDLYDFLINGVNNSQRLQSQDVILVPVIGEVAAVAGHVKRPAIYEILKETNLFDLIKMAGGLSFTGEAGRLELQRVKANRERITKDFQLPENLRDMDRKQVSKTDLKAMVEDGDLIKVFPVQPTIQRTVFLRGHVKRPGAYEFRGGMTIRDLIPSLDTLKEEPYTEFVQVVRVVPPSDEKQAVFVDLQAALRGDAAANIPLQERDQIIVYSKDELNLKEKVEISGRVNRPGTYFYFDGMTLKDLIFMAGNVTQDAYLGNVEIARYKVESDQLKLDRIQKNLSETLKGSPEANPALAPKDRVFVQGMSNWQMKNYVEVAGEVNFPGKYPYLPGERLSSVIERAGGFSKKAFLPGAVFTRVSVREIQQRSLKQQIAQLEESILQEQVRPREGAKADDLKDMQEASVARRTMLRNLQEAEVTGRMVIKLTELKSFRGSKYDIQLEPDDKLTVPPIPSAVTVMGEVYNPTSIVYNDGQDVQYYLDMAGGPNVNADTDSIFVVRADGSVVSHQQNRGFLLKNFYQMEVERGDTILVPKDISRFSWLATTKDITDILFKIASTTGITIQAFK